MPSRTATIDRPIIVGTAYNGSGNTDAQGNQIGSGTMQASANAPAFFAGKEDSTHTHHASLSGLKSQQLNTSRSGQGGYNQLVFDDTPGESRIELGTTEYQSALQVGHLKQQTHFTLDTMLLKPQEREPCQFIKHHRMFLTTRNMQPIFSDLQKQDLFIQD